MNDSDIKRLKESFDAIGAGLVYTTISMQQYIADYLSRYRRGRMIRFREEQRKRTYCESVKDYDFKVVKTGKTEKFQLTVKQEIANNLHIQLSNIDKKNKIIILTFRYLDESKVFLCSNEKGRPVIGNVRAGTRGGIEPALKAVERPARITAPKTGDDYEKDLKKAKNKIIAPSIEKIRKILGDSFARQEYDFYLLLFEKCKKKRFFTDTRQVISVYLTQPQNTFQNALMRVAHSYSFRIRDVADWKTTSHNPQKQFSSLVRHLFVEYKLPLFFDSVWFRRRPDWIPWFIEVGQGKSIRRLKDFPLPYTKKMWHALLKAPSTLSMEQAIRWGQVTALGGNYRFFREIENTRMHALDSDFGPPGDLETHAFWQTVIEWFLRQPMLDPAHYGPIVDFINHQKFFPPRENPDFQITGRAPEALLNLVDQWHSGLGKAKGAKLIYWVNHNLDWQWEQKRKDTVLHIWEMRELLTNYQLREEGRKMHHCVYTYTGSCQAGRSVILSLRCDERRVLTVEYLPGIGKLGSVRGVSNRLPTQREMGILKRWAADKNLQKALSDDRLL